MLIHNVTYSFFSAANNIALPSITTPITIVGSGAPNFRLFNVTAIGSLSLQDLTLRSENNGGAIIERGQPDA